MGVAVLLVLLLAVLVIGGGIAFAVALASKGSRQFAAQNEIIPGVASGAPPEWAGAHSLEATLHRRLGEAVRGLQAQAGSPGEDMGLLELRVEIEQQALAVDQRLIATAALPVKARAEALSQVQQAVEAVEVAAGQVASEIASTGIGGDSRSLAELAERVRLVTDARAEIDALDWDTPDAVDSDPAPESSRQDPDGQQPQAGTA
jgi:hypothetical protein